MMLECEKDEILCWIIPTRRKKHPPHTYPTEKESVEWNLCKKYLSTFYLILSSSQQLVHTHMHPSSNPHHQLAPISFPRGFWTKRTNSFFDYSHSSPRTHNNDDEQMKRWKEMEREKCWKIFSKICYSQWEFVGFGTKIRYYFLCIIWGIYSSCATQSSPFLYLCMDDWGVWRGCGECEAAETTSKDRRRWLGIAKVSAHK